MVTITLTDEDLVLVERVARRRLDDAKRLHAVDRFREGSPYSNSLYTHYWGCTAECATAHMLGVVWRAGSGEWAVRDVERYEVRGVGPGTPKYIKTKDNDPLERAIALGLCRTRHVVDMVGWTTGRQIREMGQYEDPGNRGHTHGSSGTYPC